MLKKHTKTITAVDIGTSKICVLVGEIKENNLIEILGYGERSSEDAIYKGDILNVDEVMEKLSASISDAEKLAKTFIDHQNIYASISGPTIKSVDEQGVISIKNEDGRVKEEDIRKAALIARNAFGEPEEREIITATDKYFILNGEEERRISSPINHRATRLKGIFHIISAKKNYINNLKTIIMTAFGSTFPPHLLFSGIASAFGTASEEDLKQGVLFIDMGAGTTDYVLIVDRCVYHSACLTVGCDHIANDISIGLDINFKLARTMVRRKYFDHSSHERTFIEVDHGRHMPPRKLPVHSIEKITELRLQELFEIIYNDIKSVNMHDFIRNDVIISGGGAVLPLTPTIAESVFNKNIKIGTPRNVNGEIIDLDDPRYSTVCGLLCYAAHILPNRDSKKDDKGIFGSLVRVLDNFSISFIQKLRDLKDAIKI